MKIKLHFELIPKTTCVSSIRPIISKRNWDVLRLEAFENAGYKCQICNDTGEIDNVSCHEIWEYDDENYIQILKGLITLCPSCHAVKHLDATMKHGLLDLAISHLSVINLWSREKSIKYINRQLRIWRERSKYEWKLDLTWLNGKGIKYNL